MGEETRNGNNSRKKPANLRVEVPNSDDSSSEQQSVSHSGDLASSSSRSGNRWGKVLQSPQAFVDKIASKAKIVGKMSNSKNIQTPLSPMMRSRTSVDPYRRAAIDAQYRSELELRSVSILKFSLAFCSISLL